MAETMTPAAWSPSQGLDQRIEIVATWLYDALRNGDKPCQEVEAEARANGFSESELYAAIAELKVVTYTTTNRNVETDRWRLPIDTTRYEREIAQLVFMSPGGMLKTEICLELRHIPAPERELALANLCARGTLHPEKQSTGGRPATLYVAGNAAKRSCA